MQGTKEYALQKAKRSSEQLHQLYRHAADLHARGYTERSIQYRLQSFGLSASEASRVTADVRRGYIKAVYELDGSADLFYGATILIIGLLLIIGVLTGSSQQAPDSGLVIAILGTLAFGGWQFLRGLLRARRRD